MNIWFPPLELKRSALILAEYGKLANDYLAVGTAPPTLAEIMLEASRSLERSTLDLIENKRKMLMAALPGPGADPVLTETPEKDASPHEY